jgi:hypothetical protein
MLGTQHAWVTTVRSLQIAFCEPQISDKMCVIWSWMLVELCCVLVELCFVLVELCCVLVELCCVLVELCCVLVELCLCW